MQGTINVPVTITATGKINQWISDDITVNMRIALDTKSMSFTPSQNKTYKFSVIEDGVSRNFEVVVGGTTPTPTPIPTPTGTLWDSNINGKWNDGNKRTLTTNEGGQKPDDKSIFCAASGNPKLIIDGDGIAHLQAGSGGVDNLSIRLRSRHQGECNNVSLEPAKRFGGHGWAIDSKGAVDFKTEDYHNVHSNAHSFTSGISVGTTWHHVHQTCKGTRSSFTIDGKNIGEVTVFNHGDNSLLSKNSYIWLRLNNSDHGRIYIMAINIDSALDFDFMFEPTKSSIAFKNVKLVGI